MRNKLIIEIQKYHSVTCVLAYIHIKLNNPIHEKHLRIINTREMKKNNEASTL